MSGPCAYRRPHCSRDESALPVEAGEEEQAFLECLLTHLDLLYDHFGLEALQVEQLGREVDDHRREVDLLEAVEQPEVEHRQVAQRPDPVAQLLRDVLVVEQLRRELVQGRELQVKICNHEDDALHLEELAHGVEPVAGQHILLSLKGVDLVVLRGHEQRGDS